MTLPLITDDAGDKFGKSVPNPVWVDPKLMSPFDFYQFFIRSPDTNVEKLLNLFTFFDHNEVKKIMADHEVPIYFSIIQPPQLIFEIIFKIILIPTCTFC